MACRYPNLQQSPPFLWNLWHRFITEHRIGSTMDARDYDRIADLLMQIRQKYSVLGVSKLSKAVFESPNDSELYDAIDLIELLLQINDNLGQADAKGWL